MSSKKRITNGVVEFLLKEKDAEILALKNKCNELMNFTKVLIQKNEYQKQILKDCEKNCPYFKTPPPMPPKDGF